MKDNITEVVDNQLSVYRGKVCIEEVVDLLSVLGDKPLPEQQDRVDYTFYRLILLLLKKIETLEKITHHHKT